MKTPTSSSNKERKDSIIVDDTLSNENIKHMMNDAMLESKNIVAEEMLPLLLAKDAMEWSNWIGLSALAITSPLLSIVSFMRVREKVHLDKVERSAPINMWTVIMQHSGCKKTPVYRCHSENLEHFKRFYMRNFVPSSLADAHWAGGAAEALKSLLGDLSTECCFMAFFNEFNEFLGDMNKCNNSNDDNNVHCNTCDGIAINNHTKGE